MNDPFSNLYVPYGEEAGAFGPAWCGPDKYEYGKDALVARYEAEGDGQPVEVYCNAMPARFYKLKVLAGKDSIGGLLPPWELGTGSGEGMARLAAKMARAIAGGMLSLKQPTDN